MFVIQTSFLETIYGRLFIASFTAHTKAVSFELFPWEICVYNCILAIYYLECVYDNQRSKTLLYWYIYSTS